MGVLNMTPDSFSDGGLHPDLDSALKHAEQMLGEGADIIDVGGESTRPGAAEVGVAEELDRVIPVIQAIARNLEAAISIDTSKPQVMREAASAGVAMINDVRALSVEGSAAAARGTGLPVCIMHMQGSPATMQRDPTYADVVADILAFLHERITDLAAAGFPTGRLIVDPGFGFGKSVEQNLQVLRELNRFCELGHPVLVGLSRKSILKTLTGSDIDHRLAGSIALATLAAERGAQIIRTHDVAETLDAIRVVSALMAG